MTQYWHLLPSTGYTIGFIPRVETQASWSSQMNGWFGCLGARGVITLKSVSQQAQQASSIGYTEIMSNGYNGLDGDPDDAPSAVTTIYLDEPLSQNGNYGDYWDANTLAALAEACIGCNPSKKLAIGESMGPNSGVPPSSDLFEYIADIIAPTHSILGDDLLIMPMHYFNNGWSPEGQGENVGSLNAWWESLCDEFPSVKFAPWLAPTCGLPNPTTGCCAGWIKDSLDYADSLGWKKVYFYLEDGFAFPTGVREGLLDSGWAYEAEDDHAENGCAYNLGGD